MSDVFPHLSSIKKKNNKSVSINFDQIKKKTNTTDCHSFLSNRHFLFKDSQAVSFCVFTYFSRCRISTKKRKMSTQETLKVFLFFNFIYFYSNLNLLL